MARPDRSFARRARRPAMSADLISRKQELRRVLRAAIKDLSEAATPADSLRACDLLRQQSVWKEARFVLFFMPLRGEIDLTSFYPEALAHGKKILLPRFNEITAQYDAFQIHDAARDCAPGKFGIAEPAAHGAPFPLMNLDLILVPGVGFDVAGRRLGRGRGFYDRLLAQSKGVKCGVAFDQQIVEQIPGEKHDVPMNFILTPTRWIKITE
jgi:5-formyltetrahydrofolate cyclo-ligase